VTHSDQAIAALIRQPGITATQRKILIGAVATIRRGRPLSAKQDAVVSAIMAQALREE
jgi:hypothetical protein